MADIYFRTDGNSEIATGHLMRCLAIARACAQEGLNVGFIVSDEESAVLLQERFAVLQEFDIRCLHRDYKDLEHEIPSLLSCLAQDTEKGKSKAASDRKPWLFIDSYYVSASYFKALRNDFRTAYLDDLQSFSCAVDLVINYDTEEDCDFYSDASRKLLGAQYTPLREQFRSPAYEVRPAAEHVLLSTGGTDPYRVAESLLRCIYDVPSSCAAPPEILRSMHYHVLTSRTNTRYGALDALAKKHPSIHIHTNVTEVAALMASCDLAVSAGGTTLCELCAVGVPSVSYLMAENQRIAVEAFTERKLIPCAGDIRPVDFSADSVLSGTGSPASPVPCPTNTGTCNPTVLSRILGFLSDMAQDPAARAEISAAMRNYLDGTGAQQIARALVLS